MGWTWTDARFVWNTVSRNDHIARHQVYTWVEIDVNEAAEHEEEEEVETEETGDVDPVVHHGMTQTDVVPLTTNNTMVVQRILGLMTGLVEGFTVDTEIIMETQDRAHSVMETGIMVQLLGIMMRLIVTM